MLLFALVLLASQAAIGKNVEQYQSKESITQAVSVYLQDHIGGKGNQIEIELNSIDDRLRLIQCKAPLDIDLRSPTTKRGRVAIAVSCSEPKRWKFYLGAMVREYGKAIIAKASIPRNTVLSAADVELKDIELTNLHQGYYESIDDIVGMVTKRILASGKIISPRAVNRRQLVNRGDKVIIKAVVEGIEVRMNGEAMANGANGERISVKNLSSNRIINAVVTAQGIVSVIL